MPIQQKNKHHYTTINYNMQRLKHRKAYLSHVFAVSNELYVYIYMSKYMRVVVTHWESLYTIFRFFSSSSSLYK